MHIIDVAKCCHEANRALCVAVGDFSQKPWADAEGWQRVSALKGVQYFMLNGQGSGSAQHDAWCDDKYSAGWVYGKVKDAEAKTHPCLLPFEQLPIHQQAKDTLFKAMCQLLVPLL